VFGVKSEERIDLAYFCADDLATPDYFERGRTNIDETIKVPHPLGS
jgi:hypothetical protein